MIFSWVFEMTPDGIKLESKIAPGESVTPDTGRKLDRTIITFLALAVVLLLGERFIIAGTMLPFRPRHPIAAVEQTSADS